MPDRKPFPADTESADPAATDPFATFVSAEGREAAKCDVRYDALVRGDQIGDFRIQRLLGRGSFGAVYLARELTLDRLVAIKVVLPGGRKSDSGEGRNLAQLKHPNIVGVYGEAHDSQSGCRLLWMQFVDGCNLARVIAHLHNPPRVVWTESDMIAAASYQTRDDTSSKQPRGVVETVCRVGQQLSAAIEHAHRCGVTHRDIKPANILMQCDGVPLLADFNLADLENDDEESSHVGGTIAYMPPEQLARFLGSGPDYDGRRADIYSLGVVLWELACGTRPYAGAESEIESRGQKWLENCLKIRSQEISHGENAIDLGLEMILRRAMAVEPSHRYTSARAMGTALNGLAELQRVRRRLPEPDRWTRWVRRHLYLVIAVVGILPHLAASFLQSLYNHIWIQPGGSAFANAFIAYNIVVYPACVGWLCWNLYKFAQGYRRVVARVPIPRGQLRKLRARLLRLPRQFMIASAVGWFPGVVLFPWLLGLFGEPPTRSDWFHYGMSFTIAGLIATTYSYAFVLYVAVCCGYPACWQTASQYRDRARRELSGMAKRISIVSILVGVLPLAAAVLLLAIGMPSLDVMNLNHMVQMQGLHRLVIELIVAGAIGLYLVETASARLTRVVRTLTLTDE